MILRDMYWYFHEYEYFETVEFPAFARMLDNRHREIICGICDWCGEMRDLRRHWWWPRAGLLHMPQISYSYCDKDHMKLVDNYYPAIWCTYYVLCDILSIDVARFIFSFIIIV